MCIYPCQPQEELIRFLFDHSIVPVAYSPIGRIGSTMGPVTTVNMFDDSLIRYLSKKYNKTPTQILLAWGLSRGYPVIPKASSLKHQKENLAALDFRLLKENVDSITGRFTKLPPLFPHTSDNKYTIFA